MEAPIKGAVENFWCNDDNLLNYAAELQRNFGNRTEGSISTTIPKQLHFIWIGCFLSTL